jgi:hypothetical protein
VQVVFVVRVNLAPDVLDLACRYVAAHSKLLSELKEERPVLRKHPRSRFLGDLQYCVFAQVAFGEVQRDRDRKLLQEAQNAFSAQRLEVAPGEVEVEFFERRHAKKTLEERAEGNRRNEGAGEPRLLFEPEFAPHQVRAALESFDQRFDADVFQAAAGEVEFDHEQLDSGNGPDKIQAVRVGYGLEFRSVETELLEAQEHLETFADLAEGLGGQVLVELEVERGKVAEVDEVAAGLDDAFGLGVCAG